MYGWNLGNMDGRDLRQGRSFMKPGNHCFNLLRIPFDFCFNGTIGTIADPAAQLQSLCFAGGIITEKNTLYPTLDPRRYSFPLHGIPLEVILEFY